MKRINFPFLFPLLALAILTYALSSQMFGVPPIGKILDPFAGAVQGEGDSRLSLPHWRSEYMGLSDSTYVYFDTRKVPHIYAKTTEDMYFAQGYVTACLRLWQMDFISYVAAGRLSEIFDQDGYVEYDRYQRRLGILDAAKKTLAFIENDAETRNALTAYTRGVNAYIRELNYKSMPIEYKLLDYKPEPWTLLKSVLMLKMLSNTLSGYEEDMFMTKMMLALGEDGFNKLYPDWPSHISPVMNTVGDRKDLAATKIKIPGYLNFGFISASGTISPSSYNPFLGSNSWAVSGKKTKSGHPILANDPHLGLNLPCFWLEMQLSSPGMNVYGVTIPGTPSVIIGFNDHIAWGLTNGADDVRDWYKLKLSEDYKEYEMDGKWMPLSWRVEEIRRKRHAPLLDTVYSSVQGPIVIDKRFQSRQQEMLDCALSWTLHQPANEFRTFIGLNKARDYKDYKEAIRTYSCPILNFTFANKDTIAVDHEGTMPAKKPGEGKFILDGTKSEQLFTRSIPRDSLPHLLNPPMQYVHSANQHPTYPGYPYYYNGYYIETRAAAIERWLSSNNDLDISTMEAMQLDNTNFFAVNALPVLTGAVAADRLKEGQRRMFDNLRNWKETYNADDTLAELFELWMQGVRSITWDELKVYPFYIHAPSDYTLIDLIQKSPEDPYFDKVNTSRRENASDVVTEAFVAAVTEYERKQREGSVRWGDLHHVNIMHMTNISAFSAVDMPSGGDPDAINATSGGWGPSWRFIVEMGDVPKAFGIYPGGQSGNPGSRYYDNFLPDWRAGKYYPLQFMSKDESANTASGSWTFK